jgi:hypothetical protein
MFKSIFLTATLIMIIGVSNIQCQVQDLNHLEIGVKGGLNISNLYTSDASNSDMIPGFNVGVFATMPVDNLLSFQPELYVSTKGGSVTYNNLFVDGTANFNLTYIEMPVLGVFNLTRFVNFQVGPYISYLVDGKVTNKANVNLFNFEQNINVNNYNRLDAGIIVGLGIVAHKITMGLRYSYGLTKVGKEQTFLGTTYTIPNSANGVINFYLAVPVN